MLSFLLRIMHAKASKLRKLCHSWLTIQPLHMPTIDLVLWISLKYICWLWIRVRSKICTRSADSLVHNWMVGNPIAFDLTVASSLNPTTTLTDVESYKWIGSCDSCHSVLAIISSVQFWLGLRTLSSGNLQLGVLV